MNILRGCVEALFSIDHNELAYSSFIKDVLSSVKERLCHIEYFKCYSKDEQENIYRILHTYVNGRHGTFTALLELSNLFLNCTSSEPVCVFNNMLRWRMTSFLLGQDLFTTIFLANYDLEQNLLRTSFDWSPIIKSDDTRLHAILKQGIADNHFHLNGSTQIQAINWISLMNKIDRRQKEFNDLIPLTNYIIRKNQINYSDSLQKKCLKAAYIRALLFQNLYHDDVDICTKYKNIGRIDIDESFVQDEIVSIKHGRPVLDYALDGLKQNNCNYILSGERKFMYDCFKTCFSSKSDNFVEYLFFIYLLLKNNFRNEVIQTNNEHGFQNFENYQSHKEKFIYKDNNYKTEAIRLALKSTLDNQPILFLEARIAPKKTAAKLLETLEDYEAVLYDADRSALHKNTFYAPVNRDYNTYAGYISSDKFNIIDNSRHFDNARLFNEEKYKRNNNLSYVLHFIKIKDTADSIQPADNITSSRHCNLRATIKEQAQSIFSFMCQNTNYRYLVKGIDACSTELGCRPEVFAEQFRYLRNVQFTTEGSYPTPTKLRATYHAGEDFHDITDGLRAIDEAILFCNLKRGDRIGHALALGVDPETYYRKKSHTLVMSSHDRLDDIAWVIGKTSEYNINIEISLLKELETEFSALYNNIYQNTQVSPDEYYQAWLLRGDNPEIYFYNTTMLQGYHKKDFLIHSEKYKLNQVYDNNGHERLDAIRKNSKCVDLYYKYHFDPQIKKNGYERMAIKIPKNYPALLSKIQDAMQNYIAKYGIAIETNPSSNFLINRVSIERYDMHPILRFNKINNDPNSENLSVSINTDDQGVFDTFLENEYALLAIALQKKGYPTDDVYSWIERIRKLGLEQVFK